VVLLGLGVAGKYHRWVPDDNHWVVMNIEAAPNAILRKSLCGSRDAHGCWDVTWSAPPSLVSSFVPPGLDVRQIRDDTTLSWRFWGAKLGSRLAGHPADGAMTITSGSSPLGRGKVQVTSIVPNSDWLDLRRPVTLEFS